MNSLDIWNYIDQGVGIIDKLIKFKALMNKAKIIKAKAITN